MSEKNLPFPEIKIISDAAFNINNQIFLLGAKHFSPEHIALVEDQLQYIQPDVLMIQMDQESYNTLHHFYAQFRNKQEITAFINQKAFISHLSVVEALFPNAFQSDPKINSQKSMNNTRVE
jgi:hypothetical protein